MSARFAFEVDEDDDPFPFKALAVGIIHETMHEQVDDKKHWFAFWNSPGFQTICDFVHLNEDAVIEQLYRNISLKMITKIVAKKSCGEDHVERCCVRGDSGQEQTKVNDNMPEQTNAKKRRTRRPLSDEQRAILTKARSLSKVIGLIGTLDRDGLEQVQAFLNKQEEAE